MKVIKPEEVKLKARTLIKILSLNPCLTVDIKSLQDVLEEYEIQRMDLQCYLENNLGVMYNKLRGVLRHSYIDYLLEIPASYGVNFVGQLDWRDVSEEFVLDRIPWRDIKIKLSLFYLDSLFEKCGLSKVMTFTVSDLDRIDQIVESLKKLNTLAGEYYKGIIG